MRIAKLQFNHGLSGSIWQYLAVSGSFLSKIKALSEIS